MRNPQINIGNRAIGIDYPPFIIADVANTHEGSFDVAREMVDKIADTGIDAIKFQLHIASAEMLPSHPKFTTQGKRSLPANAIADLKAYSESKGLMFLCTPFSREATDLLDDMNVAAFKIGSGEVSDPDFIAHVARKGRPMIVSTGMAENEEVDAAVSIMQTANVPFAILHAISLYPTPYDRLYLETINTLRDRYGVPIGLSDHTAEIYSSLASMAFKPAIIEKHYTLDRNTVGTSDHKVSLLAEEFKQLVDAVHKLHTAMGSRDGILEEEQSVVSWARHAVVTLRTIKQGEVFDRSNITTKRPLMDGIPAKEFATVLGKRAIRDIAGDSLLKRQDVDKS